MQGGLTEVVRRKPMVNQVTAISLPEAFSRGLVIERKRPSEIEAIMREDELKTREPLANIYGLRFPEKDANTERDYMRLSFREED